MGKAFGPTLPLAKLGPSMLESHPQTRTHSLRGLSLVELAEQSSICGISWCDILGPF